MNSGAQRSASDGSRDWKDWTNTLMISPSRWRATLALGAFLVVSTTSALAQAPGTTNPGTRRKPSAGSADPMATARGTLKTRYGFSDAQASEVLRRTQIAMKEFEPQILALQKKYGGTKAPEQRQKMQAELAPLILRISRKTTEIALSVATKAQRPKILDDQKKFDEMNAMRGKTPRGSGQ